MQGIRVTAMDVWTVAQTAWGEARNQGSSGLYAVIWVVRNRHDFHQRWKDRALREICRAPFQFSCWNYGDPNLAKLRQVSLDDRIFCQCLVATTDVLGGLVMSNVEKATHYYADGTPVPTWALNKTPCTKVGQHLFFQNIL